MNTNNDLKLTVREIRRILFDTDKCAVINAVVMTNKEARDFLYSKENQDEELYVVHKRTHLLIFN